MKLLNSDQVMGREKKFGFGLLRAASFVVLTFAIGGGMASEAHAWSLPSWLLPAPHNNTAAHYRRGPQIDARSRYRTGARYKSGAGSKWQGHSVSSVPELDGNTAGMALVLLAGTAVLLNDRRRRVLAA